MMLDDGWHGPRWGYYRGFMDGVHTMEWEYFGFAEDYSKEFPSEPGVWGFQDTFKDVESAVAGLRQRETMLELGLSRTRDLDPVPGPAIAMLDLVHDLAHVHLDPDGVVGEDGDGDGEGGEDGEGGPNVEAFMEDLHDLVARAVRRKRRYVWDEFDHDVPNPPVARTCVWTRREAAGDEDPDADEGEA